MAARGPKQGGRLHGGPWPGKVLAYNKMVLPVFEKDGRRIGSYIWVKDHWEYEELLDQEVELYPGGNNDG